MGDKPKRRRSSISAQMVSLRASALFSGGGAEGGISEGFSSEDLTSIFSYLDVDDDGVISHSDLDAWSSQTGACLTQDEIASFLRLASTTEAKNATPSTTIRKPRSGRLTQLIERGISLSTESSQPAPDVPIQLDEEESVPEAAVMRSELQELLECWPELSGVGIDWTSSQSTRLALSTNGRAAVAAHLDSPPPNKAKSDSSEEAVLPPLLTRAESDEIFRRIDCNREGEIDSMSLRVWSRMLPVGRGEQQLTKVVMAGARHVSADGLLRAASPDDLFAVLTAELGSTASNPSNNQKGTQQQQKQQQRQHQRLSHAEAVLLGKELELQAVLLDHVVGRHRRTTSSGSGSGGSGGGDVGGSGSGNNHQKSLSRAYSKPSATPSTPSASSASSSAAGREEAVLGGGAFAASLNFNASIELKRHRHDSDHGFRLMVKVSLARFRACCGLPNPELFTVAAATAVASSPSPSLPPSSSPPTAHSKPGSAPAVRHSLPSLTSPPVLPSKDPKGDAAIRERRGSVI